MSVQQKMNRSHSLKNTRPIGETCCLTCVCIRVWCRRRRHSPLPSSFLLLVWRDMEIMRGTSNRRLLLYYLHPIPTELITFMNTYGSRRPDPVPDEIRHLDTRVQRMYPSRFTWSLPLRHEAPVSHHFYDGDDGKYVTDDEWIDQLTFPSWSFSSSRAFSEVIPSLKAGRSFAFDRLCPDLTN